MDALLLLLKYAFLGLVQGITEPIPVSSSGHLVIIEHLLGLKLENLTFEVFVNFASLVAVLLVYRKDLYDLIQNSLNYIWYKKAETRNDFLFFCFLIIATVPAATIGLLFDDVIEAYFKGITVVGVTLIITGAALWMIKNLRGSKGDRDIALKDAIIIGLAQAVALIPGISRSGATIVAAMGMGMKQGTALRFSFFLYIPISLGSGILSLTDMAKDPLLSERWVLYTISFIIALIASYYSLKWFMSIMEKGRLGYFSIYCWAVGSLIIFLI